LTDVDDLAEAIRTALLGAMDADDFDVAPGAAGELDVSTDEWTLHVEGWPDGPAWLAIDDEPDEPARYAAARRAVIPEAVEQALAGTDYEVGGALSRALAASGDPFTLDLLDALRRIRPSTARGG
jgi:hypothetical protein